MGFQSGIGFIANSSSGGSGGGNTLSMVQYKVGSVGGPTNGATSFTLPTPVAGSSCYVANPMLLTLNTDYSFATSGSNVTSITLLGGLTFNTNEVYTFWIYT